MGLRDRLEYLRTEQREILRLVQQIGEALDLASQEDFSERSASLSALRALEHGLAGVAEHCHSENRAVESTFHRYLKGEEYRHITAEHEELLKLLHDFQEELRFATADLTKKFIPFGRELIGRVRAHIGYEETLLDQIERSEEVPDDLPSWCT